MNSLNPTRDSSAEQEEPPKNGTLLSLPTFWFYVPSSVKQMFYYSTCLKLSSPTTNTQVVYLHSIPTSQPYCLFTLQQHLICLCLSLFYLQ